jgi:V(D)J recombination-activating protein 1
MDDFHVEVLTGLCRICRDVLKSAAPARQKNFCPVAKYAETVHRHYGISVENEDKSIFPSCLCNKCRSKLIRLTAKTESKTLVLPTLFHPHKDVNCICMEFGPAVGVALPPEPVDIESSVVNVEHSYSGCEVGAPPSFPAAETRKKKSLKELNRQYIKRTRLKDFFINIHELCKDRKENPVEVAYSVLIQELIDADNRQDADRIMSIWSGNGDSKLSAAECLAMRVRTTQSKTHYRQMYAIHRDKTSSNSLKPLNQLTAMEDSFFPGHCAYKLFKNDCLIEEQQVILGKEESEPKDMRNIANFPSDFPLPNVSGVEFDYIPAIAKTLTELEDKIRGRLQECGLPMDTPVHTVIKDGGDGLGDVNVKARKSDFSLTDKVFRYSFCILRCTATVNDQTFELFREGSANSVDCTRPVVICHCDESDRPSISITLANVSKARNMMHNSVMKVVSGDLLQREHTLQFIYSMVDEKFERTSSGLQGSGSRFLCTLCEATSSNCQRDVGTFKRSRKHDETVSLYKYRFENPENLNENDLAEKCKGVKAMPLICSNASERSVDSTHANINMGRVFKKILVRETAEVYEWTEKDQNRSKLQHGEKSLDELLRENLGLQSKLMMPGNYARHLFKASNHDIITSLIKKEERRAHMKHILSLYSKMQSVYSCKSPKEELPELTENYQETALQLSFSFGQHFPYVHWSNYFHKVVPQGG